MGTEKDMPDDGPTWMQPLTGDPYKVEYEPRWNAWYVLGHVVEARGRNSASVQILMPVFPSAGRDERLSATKDLAILYARIMTEIEKLLFPDPGKFDNRNPDDIIAKMTFIANGIETVVNEPKLGGCNTLDRPDETLPPKIDPGPRLPLIDVEKIVFENTQTEDTTIPLQMTACTPQVTPQYLVHFDKFLNDHYVSSYIDTSGGLAELGNDTAMLVKTFMPVFTTGSPSSSQSLCGYYSRIRRAVDGLLYPACGDPDPRDPGSVIHRMHFMSEAIESLASGKDWPEKKPEPTPKTMAESTQDVTKLIMVNKDGIYTAADANGWEFCIRSGKTKPTVDQIIAIREHAALILNEPRPTMNEKTTIRVTDIKDRIIFALAEAITLIPGSDSSIKANSGSYGDTMDAEDTLASIREWTLLMKKEEANVEKETVSVKTEKPKPGPSTYVTGWEPEYSRHYVRRVLQVQDSVRARVSKYEDQNYFYLSKGKQDDAAHKKIVHSLRNIAAEMESRYPLGSGDFWCLMSSALTEIGPLIRGIPNELPETPKTMAEIIDPIMAEYAKEKGLDPSKYEVPPKPMPSGLMQAAEAAAELERKRPNQSCGIADLCINIEMHTDSMKRNMFGKNIRSIDKNFRWDIRKIAALAINALNCPDPVKQTVGPQDDYPGIMSDTVPCV